MNVMTEHSTAARHVRLDTPMGALLIGARGDGVRGALILSGLSW